MSPLCVMLVSVLRVTNYHIIILLVFLHHHLSLFIPMFGGLLCHLPEVLSTMSASLMTIVVTARYTWSSINLMLRAFFTLFKTMLSVSWMLRFILFSQTGRVSITVSMLIFSAPALLLCVLSTYLPTKWYSWMQAPSPRWDGSSSPSALLTTSSVMGRGVSYCLLSHQ